MRRNLVTRSSAVVLAGVTSLLVATQSAPAAPAHRSTAAARSAATKALTAKRGPGGRIIVMLKDKTTRYTAKTSAQKTRANSVRSMQQNLVNKVKQAGGNVTHSYSFINAFSAKVSQDEADRLASDDNVAEVLPDEPIRQRPDFVRPHAGSGSSPSVAAPSGTCDPNGGTKLEPEALETTHTDSDDPTAKTARSLGYDGHGVRVAWIADGLDINNPDFQRNGQTIFSDYQDFSGEGPNVTTGGAEAFLDASSIAAQGNQSYDISNYTALPLDSPCKIRVEGTAPGVDLVGLDIFGKEDTGFNSSFIQAIQYAATVDHVNVLNESLGGNPYPDGDGSLDAVKAANDAAVAQGVTITTSSGDAGITNTIGSPASDPNVISLGASTNYRLNLQTGESAARMPGITGWLDNNISALSSAGYSQTARTVDLVAPGELGWALCSTDQAKYAECGDDQGHPSGLLVGGGTSQSAPLAAGVAALVIQAFRSGHSGSSPSPAQVKNILTSTADDVSAPAEQQGAGLLDAYKAVQLAKSYGVSTRTGHTILSQATHFTAIGKANASEKFTDTITNTGTSSQTVHLSSRALGGYSRIKTTTATLSDANSPKYTSSSGQQQNYEKVNFDVPSGQDRLSVAIAYRGADDPAADPTGLNARVGLVLVDPNGRYAGNSVPQGVGNFGNSQVAKPAAGTWTAYLTGRQKSIGGTNGPVQFAASVAKYAKLGGVSPSTLTLAPGASGKVMLTTSTKNTPGDRAGSLLLTTSDNDSGVPATTTVPVTMRSLIPAGRQTFSDTLTGGNGRAAFTGQTAYYNVDVPSGSKALNAYVKLGDDPTNTFYAALVNPSGNTQALGTNQTLTSFAGDPVSVPQLGADLHVGVPAKGRWTVIVVFAPEVSGTTVKEPFSVTTDQTQSRISATGMPNSPSKVLKRGQTVTAYVKVHNSGNSPEAFFLDPRQQFGADYELAPLTDPTTTEPITTLSNIPRYIVPTRTVAIAGAAQTNGPANIQADLGYLDGDPDIVSSTGKSVTMTYDAARVAPGVWSVTATEVGPFTTAGPTETVDTAMAERTQAFDTNVKPSTGDLWLESVDPSATFNTITVDAGQDATIPVRFTAPKKSGTYRGALYVDDAQLIDIFGAPVPNGNELGGLPYAYTVK